MKEVEKLIRDAAKKIAHEAVARAFHAALKSLDAPAEERKTRATKPRPAAKAPRRKRVEPATAKLTAPAIRPWSRLSLDDLGEIEAAVRSGTMADNAIARRFNVQQPKVSEMRRSFGLPALGIRPGSGPNHRGMPVAPPPVVPANGARAEAPPSVVPATPSVPQAAEAA